jgi:hypothetical protein
MKNMNIVTRVGVALTVSAKAPQASSSLIARELSADD